MNLLEPCIALVGVAGALGGGELGARVAGFPGAVVGMVIGSVGAMVAPVFGSLAAASVERARCRRILSGALGRYWDPDQAAGWSRVKDSLRGGQPVRGKVVAVRSSNLFVDIGVGFPMSLPSREIDGAGARRPRAGDDVEALVLMFDDVDRAIVATTRPRHWIIWDGTPVGWSWSDPSTAMPGVTIDCHWLTTTARQQLEQLVSHTEGVTCTLIRGDDLPLAPYRGGSGPESRARVWVELRGSSLIARQPLLPPPAAGALQTP
jgi:hypothetical protein